MQVLFLLRKIVNCVILLTYNQVLFILTFNDPKKFLLRTTHLVFNHNPFLILSSLIMHPESMQVEPGRIFRVNAVLTWRKYEK